VYVYFICEFFVDFVFSKQTVDFLFSFVPLSDEPCVYVRPSDSRDQGVSLVMILF